MAIPITLRKKIADFDPIREGITVQQFCKNIGVSKQTYYNIKARIAERGRAGIVPDSTAPLKGPNPGKWTRGFNQDAIVSVADPVASKAFGER